MQDKLMNLLIVLISLVVIVLVILYACQFLGINILSTSTTDDELQSNIIYADDTNTFNFVNETSTENVQVQRNTINVTTNAESTTVLPTVSSNINSSNYYYSQLDSYSKIIYDAIANNINNLKTGNYIIEIDSDFSDILDLDNGEELLNNYFSDAINALNLDYADLFYIDFSKLYLNIETTTTMFSTKYKLYLNSGDGTNYFANGFSTQSEVENAISQVESTKNQICSGATGSDYEKAKIIHDWLIENLSYNSDANNKSTIYGALIDRQAVCEGYARAYKYLLDEIGITNVLIIGTATNSNEVTEDHMWNYVYLNNSWYAVDVTWDDPIVTGGGTISDTTKHKYFMVGSSDFFKNHVENTAISSSGKQFSLPSLSSSNY